MWIRSINVIFQVTAIKNILKISKQRRPGCEIRLKIPNRKKSPPRVWLASHMWYDRLKWLYLEDKSKLYVIYNPVCATNYVCFTSTFKIPCKNQFISDISCEFALKRETARQIVNLIPIQNGNEIFIFSVKRSIQLTLKYFLQEMIQSLIFVIFTFCMFTLVIFCVLVSCSCMCLYCPSSIPWDFRANNQYKYF